MKKRHPTIKANKSTIILVTGASGQLGKTLEKIHVEYPELNFIFASSKELNITNKEDLALFFKKFQPDYCINCAAYTNVEQAEKELDKAFQVNAQGVKNIALACKRHDVVLLHISTDYVFDGKKKKPYTVNDETNPINEYGKSKLAGEIHIKEILEKYFIVRTSWLYSKKYGKNFYRTILQKAQKEKQISITNQQTGCPTNTENLASFLLKLIESKSKQYGIYHFCDKKVMTWFEFALQIIEENNLTEFIKVVKAENYRTFARRPEYSVLNVNIDDIKV